MVCMRQIAKTHVCGALAVALACLQLPIPLLAADQPSVPTTKASTQTPDAKALYAEGKRYIKGDGVAQDHTKAAEYLRQSAELGYAFAQNDLGALYAKGWGVKQDYDKAARWYRKAAENGD